MDINRIKKDIEYISSISATKGFGCTRFSYSEEDRQVREFFQTEFKKLPVEVLVDGAGNIRALMKGSDADAPRVLVGSHIDTVKNGGKFDGLLGVVCGLEVLRYCHENQLSFPCGIELIVFAEEEGSNFGSTMMGSKYATGGYTKDDLRKLKNDENRSALEVIADFGLSSGTGDVDLLKMKEYKAMLEMHIEQGQVLDSEGCPLGIVQGIFGMKNIKIILEGLGNHAGATPMRFRRDPMVLAGKIIAEIEKLVIKRRSDSLVATVGKILAFPNASNVIASRIEMYVDLRDIEEVEMEELLHCIREYVSKESAAREIFWKMEEIASSKPVYLSREIGQMMENICRQDHLEYRTMYSGAVHDCAMLADYIPVGMIFVPSINGRSHVPEEDTSYRDIKTGADLLCKTIMELAGK